MRLTHLALALVFGGAVASPAFAQTPSATTAPPVTAPSTPSLTRPAPAVPPTRVAPPVVAGKTAAAMAPVNINTASAADLDKLPQIGKARSQKIIQGRPYKATDELVSKKVLSQGVYDKIKDKITL